jgi:hypothetical protein
LDDGHCKTGCSKPGARIDGAERFGHGYRVPVAVTETGNPTRLVCALARGVSAAVLAEAEVEVDDVGLMSDVMGVACGFGIVMLEASFVYTKSCGGPNVHQGTYLTSSEIGVLLAFFCAIHDVAPRAARKHLGATQSEAFDEAWSFVEKNGEITRKLREAPELLEGGAFTFENKRGVLARLWSRQSKDTPPSERKRARDPEEERKLAEARALVEEELG